MIIKKEGEPLTLMKNDVKRKFPIFAQKQSHSVALIISPEVFQQKDDDDL